MFMNSIETYYEFHRDLYSTSDSYAEAVLSLNKYIDALGEYAKDVIEQMFDSCTFDVWKTSYTQDVEVASNGIATIYMNSNEYSAVVLIGWLTLKCAVRTIQPMTSRY